MTGAENVFRGADAAWLFLEALLQTRVAGAVRVGERLTVPDCPAVTGAALRTPCRVWVPRWATAALPEATGAREATVADRPELNVAPAMGEALRLSAPFHQWVVVLVAAAALRCPAPLNVWVPLDGCGLLLATAVSDRP